MPAFAETTAGGGSGGWRRSGVGLTSLTVEMWLRAAASPYGGGGGGGGDDDADDAAFYGARCPSFATVVSYALDRDDNVRVAERRRLCRGAFVARRRHQTLAPKSRNRSRSNLLRGAPSPIRRRCSVPFFCPSVQSAGCRSAARAVWPFYVSS